MHKATQLISKLVYNKFFWQFFVAIFMLAMAALFIREEHIEVIKIKEELSRSRPDFILLGIALTIIYVLAQAQMYVHSFKALNKKVSLGIALRLFLKRNLVSVFLPAGGFSSLVFFTREIEEQGISKSNIHLASTLFGFCSILSVVIVGIPVIGIALISTHLGTAELLAFIFLLLLTSGLIALIYSVAKRAWPTNGFPDCVLR